MTTNLGSTTSYFIGNYYQVKNGVVTKYYYAGSQRVAMRKNGTLTFIIGDHLGSTSLVTDSNGAVINETKYKAWGETRYSSGSEQTKYTYTGQYSYVSDFGLHFYNARWYDSSLGRFAQADTIIPEGVQGLDRYSYTFNNPLRYTDPSGHIPIDCWNDPSYCSNTTTLPTSPFASQNVAVTTQTPSAPSSITTVIGACGQNAGSNCQNSAGYNAGNGDEIPLIPYLSWANNHGYTYIPIGVDRYISNPPDGQSKIRMALAILDLIRNAPSDVYIVGHSAGADATIMALDLAIAEGLQSKIKGVALLDPYFENQGVSLQDPANRVAAALPVFLGDTLNDFKDGQPIDVTIANAVEEQYSYSHLGIAVANDVLTKIEELMGWPK